MKTQTFILMKTKDDNFGMVYEMIHSGKEVLNRKSLGVRVPYKYWNKEKKEVNGRYSESVKINQVIQERIRKFQVEMGTYVTGSEKECFLEFMRSHMEKVMSNKESLRKYRTVLKNLKYVVNNHFKREILPVSLLRNRPFIDELKSQIRFDMRYEDKFKSNSGWKNYMTVISHFIQEYNVVSGTPIPIEHYFLTKGIPKNQSKKASYLTFEEFHRLMDYVPVGPTEKNRIGQGNAKNMFIFQYFAGGIRSIDALLLTNKDFKSSGIEIKIKKTRQVNRCDYYYEMVSCLKDYYPEIYSKSQSKFKIKDLEVDLTQTKDLLRLSRFEDILEMTLEEFTLFLDEFKVSDPISFTEIKSCSQNLIEELKNVMMKDFFVEVYQLPRHFVFPYVNFEDFVVNIDEPSDFTEEQVEVLHRARNIYDRYLKDIRRNLGFENLSGHMARHSIANHLHNQGATITDIQNVLSHSSVTVTQIYVQERLSNTLAQRVLKKSFNEGIRKRKG